MMGSAKHSLMSKSAYCLLRGLCDKGAVTTESQKDRFGGYAECITKKERRS